jgi:hypothetical protein
VRLAAHPEDPDPQRGRGPADYRPDLRPMAIVLVVLLAVVLGWIVLSPMILPRP